MKKILCVLLSLFMVLGSFAFTAFAEESSEDPATTEDTTSVPDSTEEPSTDDPSTGDSTTEDPGSDEPATIRTITFFVTGGQASVYCVGDYETSVNGDEVSFYIPEGDMVTFHISPMDEGYVVSRISQGAYTVDLAEGTVDMTVERNVNIDVTIAEADTVTLSLTINDNENGSVSYDGIGNDSKRFAVGSTLDLTVTPFGDYGVQKITVNGEEIEGVSPYSSTVSVPVAASADDSGVMEIEVVFSKMVTVFVTNEEGDFTALGFEDEVEFDENSGVYTFDAPAGRTVNFTVDPDTGRQIKEVTVNNDAVTVRRNSFAVTVPSTGVANIVIEYEDASDEGPHTVTVEIEGGENGKVLYKGDIIGEDIENEIENIRHGSKLTFSVEVDEGYTVTVTVNGDECNVKSNGTFITSEVDDDMVITVVFAEEEEESSSEEPSSEDESEDNDTQFEYLRVEDVTVLDSAATVTIIISEKTKLGRDLIVRLNEYLKNKSHKVIIRADDYEWIIPGGSSFNTASLEKSGIDFGLDINTGKYADRIISRLEEIALQNNLSSIQTCVIERRSNDVMPEGTQLVVNVRKYDSGISVGDGFQWLKYDPVVDQNGGKALTDLGGIIYEVDSDGNVTITNYANAVCGVLSAYKGTPSHITVEYNKNQCLMGFMDNVTSGEDGKATNVIAWENGEDFYLYITPKDGYVFDSLVLSETTKLKLQIFDSNGEEITDSGVKGKSGKIRVFIKGFSENCKLTVNMSATQPAEPKQEPDSSTPWEIIILIAVIGITMIGGGVFFVIKWRQSNEDDEDDEFEDFDGDEE